MRRKSLEMTSNQVKNGLEWGDSMSGAPRAVGKETSRQRRSCARWVFPQPVRPMRNTPHAQATLAASSAAAEHWFWPPSLGALTPDRAG